MLFYYSLQGARALELLEDTDGIGTPDPSPKHLVNWCF